MKPATSKLSCEDVLEAFAVEPNHGRSTLERYLREYPDYAVAITHLSHELSRAPIEPGPLSMKDRALIDEAWKQYSSSSTVAAFNLFAELSVPQLRDLSSRLDVPRQIITAFREHRVIVSSIPKKFLARVATALNTNIDQVMATLMLPLQSSCSMSHKADEKPKTAPPATFEQLLIEAQVPENKRAELMAEEK